LVQFGAAKSDLLSGNNAIAVSVNHSPIGYGGLGVGAGF
jgi:hypothetical protein